MWMVHLSRLRQISPLGNRQGLGQFHEVWSDPTAHLNHLRNPNGKYFCVYTWTQLLYHRYHDLFSCLFIYSVDNTIRHQEAGEFPTLQDLDVHQTKNDSTIEISSSTNCNLWVSAEGGGIAWVRIIMDLSISSNIDTTIMLPTQCGAHHNGYREELLGDTIFMGNAPSQGMKNYTKITTINLCRQLNSRSLATSLHLYFAVRMYILIFATCSFAAKVL